MWPSLWWTRPAIADLLEIVPALFRPVRQLLFGLNHLQQISRCCWQIIQNPMHPCSSRRIWIITDQGESFCSCGGDRSGRNKQSEQRRNLRHRPRDPASSCLPDLRSSAIRFGAVGVSGGCQAQSQLLGRRELATGKGFPDTARRLLQTCPLPPLSVPNGSGSLQCQADRPVAF